MLIEIDEKDLQELQHILREIRPRYIKWSSTDAGKEQNEESLKVMDKITEAIKEATKAEDNKLDLCPDCKQQTVRAKMQGGIECTNDACDYWFCY